MSKKSYTNLFLFIYSFCFNLFICKGFTQYLPKSQIVKYDSAKIDSLLEKGKFYKQEDPLKALNYFREGLRQSNAINNKKLIVSSILNIGITYIKLSYPEEALSTFTNLLPVAIAIKDTGKIATTLINLGNLYMRKNEKIKTMNHYLEAAHYLETAADKKTLPLLYLRISNMFNAQKDYSKAIEYGILSLSTGEKLNDEVAIVKSLIGLSFSYDAVDSLRGKMPQLLEKALPIAEKNKLEDDVYSIHNNMGAYYHSTAREERALESWQKAYDLAKKLNNTHYLSHIARNLALIYNILNETENAHKYVLEAEELANKNGDVANINEVYLTRALVNGKQKKYEQAYEYLYKYINITDSMLTVKNNEKIAELEARYQNEKKKAEIIKLQKDKEIQALSLKEQAIFVYIAIAAILVLLVVLALLFRNYQQEQKLKEQQLREYEKNKQLIAIDSMLKGQEEERGRLARDLHDGLGGLLSGLKISLSDARDRINDKNAEMNILNKSINMIDLSVKEMRNVAHNLMPQALIKFGLDDALKDYCNAINSGNNLNIKYQCFGTVKRIESSAEIMIYRITQELLNNAIKHACAKEIIVQLLFGKNRLNITVEDDGTGFDTATLTTHKSAGWANIQNRVDYLKGRLDLESEKNKGTHINIEFII